LVNNKALKRLAELTAPLRGGADQTIFVKPIT